MIKYISILLTVVLTSLFFFPFAIPALPEANTKMIVAALGLCFYIFKLGRLQNGLFNKDTFVLSLYACMVSLVGLVSITYNNTPDFAYATYLISMWVWIGAAYAVVTCVRIIHGYASVRLIANYLIAVCVLQCILALLIDSVPMIKQVADMIQGPSLFLEKVNRLYGIGAALDVAGSRFAAVLIIIAVMMINLNRSERKILFPIYFLSFLWIFVVGNMIARTTTVGLLALVFFIYKTQIYKFHIQSEYTYFLVWCAGVLALTIPFLTYLYYTNLNFQDNIRYAFEGFFSLVEQGEWYVSSNEKLKNMYVFPETFKTWIIGDGYFANPVSTDPYFTGKVVAGFYMGTDVGYLRFIYYFGLIGLVAISGVIYKSAQICWKRFAEYKEMFLLLMLVNFIVWFKVSTDIFLVFAPFLMVDKEENEAYMKQVALKRQ